MDRITVEMVKMLLERNRIAGEINRVKISIRKDVKDQSREDQLQDLVLETCKKYDMEHTGDAARRGGEEEEEDWSDSAKTASRLLNFLLKESLHTQFSHKGPTHLSVFQKAMEMERDGADIIHMEVGEPDLMPPESVRDALSGSYDAGHVRYGSPRGMPELLEALAAHSTRAFGRGWGGGGTGGGGAASDCIKFTPDNVIVTPGGRFAVFAAMSTLLAPGDEVIVTRPAWPAYKDCVIHIGAKLRAINTTLEKSWIPSVSDVTDAINQNTRMIILNYPNNPTGAVLPPDVMDGIMEAAARCGAYVLGDEIYASYTRKPWRSVASYRYDKSIAVQSFSKSHAMTGLRIGYAVSSKRIIDRIASLAALCLTSVSAPIQYAALHALRSDSDGETASRNASLMSERLDVLAGHAKGMGLEFAAPGGGMYLFARVPQDGADLTDAMLREHNVALAPGSGFGPYRDFIRISVASEPAGRLADGMNRLKNMLCAGNAS